MLTKHLLMMPQLPRGLLTSNLGQAYVTELLATGISQNDAAVVKRAIAVLATVQDREPARATETANAVSTCALCILDAPDVSLEAVEVLCDSLNLLVSCTVALWNSADLDRNCYLKLINVIERTARLVSKSEHSSAIWHPTASCGVMNLLSALCQCSCNAPWQKESLKSLFPLMQDLPLVQWLAGAGSLAAATWLMMLTSARITGRSIKTMRAFDFWELFSSNDLEKVLLQKVCSHSQLQQTAAQLYCAGVHALLRHRRITGLGQHSGQCARATDATSEYCC